jgi:Trypsin-like peptidase domain
MDVQRSSGSSAAQYSPARGDSEIVPPPQRNGSAAHVVRSGPDRGWDLYLSRDDAGITVYQARWRRQAGAASTERRPATLPRTIPGYSLLNVRSSDDTDTYRFAPTAGASITQAATLRPVPPAPVARPRPISTGPVPASSAALSTGGPDAQALRQLGQRYPYGPANPSSTSHQLSEPEKYIRSLAAFRVAGDGGGTAFRLGPNNLFMTNSHVMAAGKNYTLQLGDEATTAHEWSKRSLSVKVGDVLERDAKKDFVLFRIDPADYRSGVMDRFGYLGISLEPVVNGQQVYLPNHGGDRSKQIYSSDEQGKPTRLLYEGGNLIYNALAEGGSSGSPVIDARTHQVVGLHWGRSGAAYGTRMTDIWPAIARHFEDVPPDGSFLPSRPTRLTPDVWPSAQTNARWPSR